MRKGESWSLIDNANKFRESMSASGNSTHVIKLLVSERDEWFPEMFGALILSLGSGLSGMTIKPPSNHERDLLETAANNEYDLAILLTNNIRYASGDRDQLADDSVKLVAEMTRLFHKPIIATYGHPDTPTFAVRLIEAGNAAAFRLPFKIDDMKQAVQDCIGLY